MASTVIAAAASSSMAATAIRATRCYALPYLPPRSSSSSQSFPIKQVSLTASGISLFFTQVECMNTHKEDKAKQRKSHLQTNVKQTRCLVIIESF
jgi:hypothetical protein